MPTALPRRRRPTAQAAPKRSLFAVLLNAFMVVSALALTFVVVNQEERYALGQPGYFANFVSSQPSPDIDRQP